MPVIMERVDYRNDIPRIPFLDTGNGNDYPLDLYSGGKLPEFGIWLDNWYCRCGRKLGRSAKMPIEDPALERVLDYMCPNCALEDRINACSLKGVPSLIVKEDAIECDKCYKWLSGCSSGYCVYLAILSDLAVEVKVGVTRLHRIHQRAAEGGYSAMAILLPKERNSLSLPEAHFIEKDLIKGLKVHWQSEILTVDEYFRRDIGFVGKALTKRQTIASLLSPPSQELREMIKEIALSIIVKAENRGYKFRFSIAKQLASLELADIPDVTNGDVDEKKLRSIDLSGLTTLKTRKMRGRPYRVMPNPNTIIAVKGPCVVLKGSDRCYSLRFSRQAVQGREAFDYDLVKNSSDPSQCPITLDWFTGRR